MNNLGIVPIIDNLYESKKTDIGFVVSKKPHCGICSNCVVEVKCYKIRELSGVNTGFDKNECFYVAETIVVTDILYVNEQRCIDKYGDYYTPFTEFYGMTPNEFEHKCEELCGIPYNEIMKLDDVFEKINPDDCSAVQEFLRYKTTDEYFDFPILERTDFDTELRFLTVMKSRRDDPKTITCTLERFVDYSNILFWLQVLVANVSVGNIHRAKYIMNKLITDADGITNLLVIPLRNVSITLQPPIEHIIAGFYSYKDGYYFISRYENMGTIDNVLTDHPRRRVHRTSVFDDFLTVGQSFDILRKLFDYYDGHLYWILICVLAEKYQLIPSIVTKISKYLF